MASVIFTSIAGVLAIVGLIYNYTPCFEAGAVLALCAIAEAISRN